MGKKSIYDDPEFNHLIDDYDFVMSTIAQDKDLQGFDLRVCLFLGFLNTYGQSELLKATGANKPNLSWSLNKLVNKGYVIRKKVSKKRYGYQYRLVFDKREMFTKGNDGEQLSFDFDK